MATPQANGPGVVALQGALQAATAAAEAATAALAEIKQSKVSGLVSKPKELELTGKPEADRRLWQDWRFAATQYLAVKDQQFVVSIDAAITRTDPVRMGDLSPEAQGRSQALYSFLFGLVKGRLLSILRTPSLVASSNGFEAIRLIHQEIEPSTGAASIGLLETILAIPEPPKGTPLRDSILAVERLFEDYEVSSTEKLSENLKIATLRKLLPAELKVHATLLVKDGVTYDQVKKAVTEYEVADRSFQALKPEAVYGGAIPMDVDAIQVKGKGKKGGKDGKPTCKICGKNHQGECWAKGQQGKGKTQQGKGKGDGKSQGKGKGKGGKSRSSSPEKCQICGKNNHTAQNCFQRYKGSVQQASNAAEKPGPSSGQAPVPPRAADSAASQPNHVAAIGERERSTSAETEVARATMGISSANQYGQARCLLDTGADEHICPASFAEWIKPVAHSSGPRLRDAQGKVMQHGNKYRTVTLCVKTTEGNELGIPVTFLIGPVQQPILSMGRLEDDMRANLDIKNRHFECGRHKIQVDRIMRSYHLPVWVDRPEAADQVQKI